MQSESLSWKQCGAFRSPFRAAFTISSQQGFSSHTRLLTTGAELQRPIDPVCFFSFTKLSPDSRRVLLFQTRSLMCKSSLVRVQSTYENYLRFSRFSHRSKHIHKNTQNRNQHVRFRKQKTENRHSEQRHQPACTHSRGDPEVWGYLQVGSWV